MASITRRGDPLRGQRGVAFGPGRVFGQLRGQDWNTDYTLRAFDFEQTLAHLKGSGPVRQFFGNSSRHRRQAKRQTPRRATSPRASRSSWGVKGFTNTKQRRRPSVRRPWASVYSAAPRRQLRKPHAPSQGWHQIWIPNHGPDDKATAASEQSEGRRVESGSAPRRHRLSPLARTVGGSRRSARIHDVHLGTSPTPDRASG
jgi:hypothetical protein